MTSEEKLEELWREMVKLDAEYTARLKWAGWIWE